jgi:hypothetical protein
VEDNLPPSIEPLPEENRTTIAALEATPPAYPGASLAAVSTAPSPQYRDRSTGLMIFGVMQIILGLLAGLMVPMVGLISMFSRLGPGGTMRPMQFLSAIASYAFIAVTLLTLGIGSVRMRRWARALTLVLSWYWMITGILITVLLTAMLPVMMRSILQAQQRAAGQTQEMSAGIMAVVLTIIIVFAAMFLVVVPIALVIFYSRQDVADTCRFRDPVERWTDRAPLPVLGASVVLAIQSLYLLSAALAAPMFPFFGRYLTGTPAVVCFLMFGCFDGLLAFALYGLRPAAWWLAVIAAPLRILSMALTYARADLMQAYSRMGWSDAQMQMLNSNPLFRSHVILWWSLLSAVIFFGYLVWLKRFFKAPGISRQEELLQAPTG